MSTSTATGAPGSSAAHPRHVASHAVLDRVCRSLGFGSHAHDDLGCMVWSSPVGANLVVTHGEGTAVRSVNEAARLRDAMLARIRTGAREEVTCLVVVPDSRNWRALERIVLVRQAFEYVRVITVGALVALAELCRMGALTHAQAVLILRPASPFADAVVALIAASGLGVSRARQLLTPPAPPDARTP